MAPSLVLRAGGSTAAIHPGAGGRLGQLDLGGGPLLRGPDPDLEWHRWGCYPLLPWSNRIPDGRLRFGPIDARLPATSPDGSALHGLAASCPWDVVDHDGGRAELTVRVEQDPYRVVATQSLDLVPGRLTLRLGATNVGADPVPCGIGIHPWFRRGRVRLPAERVWPGEPLPTAPPIPAADGYDLRSGAVPGPMDACFTGLTGAAVEAPGVRLGWDGPVTNVVIYSREPGWLCVEPVTMANDGFASAERGWPDHGVQVLPPGSTLAVTYTFERAD